MPINKEVLEELKLKLEQEKEELEKNLEKIAKPIDKNSGDYETTFDNIGDDPDENATEVSEYSGNLAVEKSLEKRLQEIIEALSRIKDDTYGICTNCGNGEQEIDIERLRANPAAKTCIKCG